MRLLLGLLLALLVNWGLFAIMQHMTDPKDVERQAITDTRLLDFVRLKREERPPELKKREPPKKPPPKKPPPPPPPPPEQTTPPPPPPPAPKISVPKIDIPLNLTNKVFLGDAKVVVAPKVEAAVVKAAPAPKPVVKPRPKPVKPAPDTSGANDEVVAVHTTKPKYPRAAQRRGLEGVVTISFTITKTGGVRNPGVIKATPKNVFNKAALKAIAKWKFKPKLVGGKPVERQATQEIKFRLK